MGFRDQLREIQAEAHARHVRGPRVSDPAVPREQDVHVICAETDAVIAHLDAGLVCGRGHVDHDARARR